jgi:hypothetical protein
MQPSNPETVFLQSLIVLVMASILGPWATLSALRIIRDPSRVREKSFINWVIRVGAERHFLIWSSGHCPNYMQPATRILMTLPDNATIRRSLNRRHASTASC